MNYTIKITGLKRQNIDEFEDVVTHITWRLTAKSAEGYEGYFSGATPIEDFTQLDSLTFVQYSDLKEETIISWIEDVLGANQSYKEHILDRVKESIESQRQVKVADEDNLPWLDP